MRLLALCSLLLLLAAPREAAADEVAKDAEIAALKAEVERLKAEVARLQAELAGRGRPSAPAPAAPTPASADLNAGQETSREQMRFLLYLFGTVKTEAGTTLYPALDGKNFVLHLVATGRIEKDNEGPLGMLFSPADKRLKPPGTAPYAAVTPESLRAQRFPTLTSYAGRRNAQKELAVTATSPPATTALIADLSFADGALVGFLDGKVRYLNRRDLGLGPTDPIVAGPASRSPLLQALSSE